jgi:hypothetical protein
VADVKDVGEPSELVVVMTVTSVCVTGCWLVVEVVDGGAADVRGVDDVGGPWAELVVLVGGPPGVVVAPPPPVVTVVEVTAVVDVAAAVWLPPIVRPTVSCRSSRTCRSSRYSIISATACSTFWGQAARATEPSDSAARNTWLILLVYIVKYMGVGVGTEGRVRSSRANKEGWL